MAKFPGVVVVHKEKGYTSHDVVAILKRLYNEKAGHSGTLDPNATGVLPIFFGKATKFAESFLSDTKSYVAEVILGVTTTTGDVTGEVLPGSDIEGTHSFGTRYGESPLAREVSLGKNLNFSVPEIENVFTSFKGDIMQTPPMYSAIKIGGKKLYELARKGETVERKPRLVSIYDIKLLEFRKNSFTIFVDCSKGTYIRSLCTDIGAKLGCGAIMGDLSRTRSGQFSIDRALTIDEIKSSTDVWSLVTPIEELLPYPAAVPKPMALTGVKNGNPVKLENLSYVDTTSPKHWLRADGRTIGLFSLRKDSLVCEVML